MSKELEALNRIYDKYVTDDESLEDDKLFSIVERALKRLETLEGGIGMKNKEISEEDLMELLENQPTKSIIEKDEYGQDVRISITKTGRIMMRLCPKRLTEKTDEEGHWGYKIAEDYADTDIEFYTAMAIRKLGFIEDLMEEYELDTKGLARFLTLHKEELK